MCCCLPGRCDKAHVISVNSSWKDRQMGIRTVEYDLPFEPLKTLKGQVLADFIVEHGIDLDDEVN